MRYSFAALSQRPTPAASLTFFVPGFHAACGTNTWIWRRRLETETVVIGPLRLPVAALVRTAFVPWTVRNSFAGADALAPNGSGCGFFESPIAIVVPTSDG